MLRLRSRVLLLAALGLVIGPGAVPVSADSGHGNKAQAAGQKKYKEEKHKKEKDHAGKFRDEDRVIVRDFYAGNPSALPPGLAKRGGQLPPGLAKRGGELPPGLSRGQVITPEIEVHLMPLPRQLEIQLPPPPHEVIRRIIGRDIVMIEKHNRRVLDVMRDALP